MDKIKPSQGRLQTGEHILAKIIEDKYPNVKVIIAEFKEDNGRLEVSSEKDLREINLEELEKETNEIIKKELEVKKTVYERKEIENEFDLSKIPESVKEIRIVEIIGFDKRPCKDPHVDNTKEIGYFKITNLKRKGENRYKFSFGVELRSNQLSCCFF